MRWRFIPKKGMWALDPEETNLRVTILWQHWVNEVGPI